MQQPITPDLYKSLRQHMLQEPSDKLVDRHGHVNELLGLLLLYLNVTVLASCLTILLFEIATLNRYTERYDNARTPFPLFSQFTFHSMSQALGWYTALKPKVLISSRISLGICGRGPHGRKKSCRLLPTPLPC